LTDEQREAVLMINEVERQIEWIKEVQKMTQQQGRQYQRAIKQRDEVERKKKLETAIEATMVIAQLRELVDVFKKDEVKEAFAKGTDGAVELNEEELRTLEKFNVLLQPLDGFNSFNEWHAQLGDSAKSLYYVVKGTEDELFPNVTGTVHTWPREGESPPNHSGKKAKNRTNSASERLVLFWSPPHVFDQNFRKKHKTKANF
jgi:hypothetical protein